MTTRERAAELVKAWPKVYPNAHCELDLSSCSNYWWQQSFLRNARTSASIWSRPNCSRNIERRKITRRRHKPKWIKAIRSTGFYRNKAKSIRAAMHAIAGRTWREGSRHDGEITVIARSWAQKLPTSFWATRSEKTRESWWTRTLSACSQRLGLTKHKDAEKIEPAIS